MKAVGAREAVRKKLNSNAIGRALVCGADTAIQQSYVKSVPIAPIRIQRRKKLPPHSTRTLPRARISV